MTMIIDFEAIVKQAWYAYDKSREIRRIADISAKVSTNHVYRINFVDGGLIIAKLSYFGQYEYFVEDHTIINALSNNLPEPFDHFLARSLMKGNSLFVYRHRTELIDAWVVFYRPIQLKKRPPRRLNIDQIITLGQQTALFHKSCHQIRYTLPKASKTMKSDIYHLLDSLNTDYGRFEYRMHEYTIREQCSIFLENVNELNVDTVDKIPVFVDWNIGNFSVTNSFKLYSRWDYDWFRVGPRVLDFYFLSRVVSDVGDRTVFSYVVSTLMEERFVHFLKAYHEVFPLTATDIHLMKEAYRFFVLNYVIKYGKLFYHEIFATKLQKEAYENYLPSVDKHFDAEKILLSLGIS